MAALAAFTRLERRAGTSHRDPLVDLRLFASRAFGGGLITAAVVVIAQAGTMFVLAVFLQTTHHLTPIAVGRWLLPVGVAALIGAQIGGAVTAKAGPTIVVRTGILIQLVGILGAAAVPRTDVAWLPLGAAIALFGLGAGMASSQLTNVILSEVAASAPAQRAVSQPPTTRWRPRSASPCSGARCASAASPMPARYAGRCSPWLRCSPRARPCRSASR